MVSLSHLIANVRAPRFRRRLKRQCVRYLTRLHDRTAILRNMHRAG
jgi:hypothetical protein